MDLRVVKGRDDAHARFFYFGSKFQLFNIAVAVSLIALIILFLPFAKSTMLATIFSLAFLGAAERISFLSRAKKIALFSFLGIVGITFIALSTKIVKLILLVAKLMSDPTFLSQLRTKVSELFSPTLQIIRDRLSDSLESKFAEAISHLFDSIFNFTLKGLSAIPNNVLQISFFIFLLIFLIRKISLVEHSGFSFFSQKNNAAMKSLISLARRSAYNSVGITLVTALAQASVLTTGSVITGIAIWPIIFIASFISSMIPLVGQLPIAISCTIYALTVFGTKDGIVMGLFALGALFIDNILRPLLISSNHSNLNPILSFFALIGSLFIFGFAGLFIGPFILVFTSTLLKKIV